MICLSEGQPKLNILLFDMLMQQRSSACEAFTNPLLSAFGVVTVGLENSASAASLDIKAYFSIRLVKTRHLNSSFPALYPVAI